MSGAASWASRLGIVALVAFLGGPLLAHLQIVPALVGFLLYDLGGLLALITLVLGVIGGLRSGFSTVRTALGLAVLIFGVFVSSAMRSGNVPRINDITTDTTSPPQFVHAGTFAKNRGRDMAYPGPSFAEQQRAGYPNLKPLHLPSPPDDVLKHVEATARLMPDWEVTRVDPANHALEGVATSRLFRFQDDFVVEVRPDGSGSLVQMRSKSRDGKGDIGANAARIQAFFTKLGG